MKRFYLLSIIVVIFFPIYSQERESAERIEFIIESPPKMAKADGWRLNSEGDWNKNQNIMSGRNEDIWNSIPSNFNFKEFYFNKFEYRNNIYYCLIIEKFQRRFKYPSIKIDPFKTDEVHFFIYKSNTYLSLVNFFNNKTQGIKFIQPIAQGECSSYGYTLSDKYIRLTMKKKLEFYYELLEIVKNGSLRIWEDSRKIRKSYKTYDKYLDSRIEENDSRESDKYSFALNYQIINDNEIIRFLLPYYNMSYSNEEKVKKLFTNTYFEVFRSEFANILIK